MRPAPPKPTSAFHHTRAMLNSAASVTLSLLISCAILFFTLNPAQTSSTSAASVGDPTHERLASDINQHGFHLLHEQQQQQQHRSPPFATPSRHHRRRVQRPQIEDASRSIPSETSTSEETADSVAHHLRRAPIRQAASRAKALSPPYSSIDELQLAARPSSNRSGSSKLAPDDNELLHAYDVDNVVAGQSERDSDFLEDDVENDDFEDDADDEEEEEDEDEDDEFENEDVQNVPDDEEAEDELVAAAAAAAAAAQEDGENNLVPIERQPVARNEARKRGFKPIRKSHQIEPNSNYVKQRHRQAAVERGRSAGQREGEKSSGSSWKLLTQHPRRDQKQPPASARVPYKSPVVVSISDNSFVSASPADVTSSTPSESTSTERPPATSSSNTQVDLASHNDREPASTGTNLTTSTTATTTSGTGARGRHLANHLIESQDDISGAKGRENLLEIEAEHVENSRSRGRAHSKKATHMKKATAAAAAAEAPAAAPVVFSESNRYNYIVSDELESDGRLVPAARRPPYEQQSSNGDQVKGSSLDQADDVPSARQMSPASSTTMQPAPTTTGSDNVAPDAAYLSKVLVVDDEAETRDEHDEPDDDAADEDDEDVDSSDRLDELGEDESNRRTADDMERVFARPSQQLEAIVHESAKYSNLIVSPQNELPLTSDAGPRLTSYDRRRLRPHLASIRMIQGNPNDYQQQSSLSGAIIAVLFVLGVTGMLVMIVSVKMRSIRERIAHKGRRRSLVPDTDFLINTIPI